jgi:hypothetical protein
MADDVKVKFGGDFTDVSKGASEAVNKAGGALSSWFSDFNKSTVASITSALALSAVFGKFTESMSNTLKTAKGIDEAFKRFGTGKSSQEFQLLARYGAEVGVSMEAVGRTMNYFSKASADASKQSGERRNVLRALKFTEEEIQKNNISAIEVLRRMADEYDRTGLEALSAQRAVQLFGSQGEQLSAIYKNGKISLDEFAKSVTLMSDATVASMAKTERRIERTKRTMADLSGIVFGEIGREGSASKAEGAVIETMSGQYGQTGGTPEQEGRSIGAQIYSDLKDDEDALAKAIEMLRDYERDDLFTSEKKAMTAEEAVKTMLSLMKEEKKAQPEGPPLLQVAKVMAVSSLQEIGGGDVNSVLSGTYQSSMLDAANKTAENTSKLAQDAGKIPPSKPVNVAK